MNQRLALGILAIVLAAAIIGTALSYTRSPRMELPQGEQTVTGVLKNASLSPTRRGTHLLEVDGEPFVFVESSTMTLFPFEDLTVTVTGTFEENTDEDLLPVLIATDVRLKALSLLETSHKNLGITLSVPDSWTKEETEDMLSFTSSGSLGASLSIRTEASEDLLPGTSLTVGGKRAVRVTTEGGETVYIDKGANKTIALAFRYSDGGNKKEDEYLFRQVILPSVKFTGSATASVSSQGSAASAGSAVSSAGLGQPCGGPAGILCPKGQYCEVTDHETDIGRCKAL
jgi:hypothetical protein